MKILVTGASGYIGSMLVPMLLQKGYQVVAVDNLMFDQTSLFVHMINPNFEFIEGDVRNKDLMQKALSGADFMVHLAALVGAPLCKRMERDAWEINLEATKMLNEIRGACPMFYPSTTSGYGTQKKVDGVCTEETPQEPISVYGVSKCDAEKAILDKGNCFTYRYATGFGVSPRFRLDLMLNDFVYKALRQRSLVVFEKKFRRSFIHVSDMARSIVFGIENFANMKNEVYNAGSEDLKFTKEQLCYLIQAKVPMALYFSDGDFDPDKRDYNISFAKLASKGFERQVGIDQGLNELVKVLKHFRIRIPHANVPYA